MRFKIICEIVEGNSFPQDYRRSILKLFKTGLCKYQDIFNDFFNSNKTKKYSWSVYFKNSKFEKGRVYLQDEKKEFIINFSVLNNSDSINIFNAFISIKYKEINTIIIENRRRRTSSIIINKFIINFTSYKYNSFSIIRN